VANWGERNLVLEKSPSQKILKSKGVNGLEIEEDAQGVMQKVSHNCWGNSPVVGSIHDPNACSNSSSISINIRLV
jgi:hypothetical protein